jgi:hypothetical protein
MAQGFAAFLAEALAGCAQTQPHDDPPALLLRVIETLGTGGEQDGVGELLGHALALIPSPHGSDGPAARDDLVLAAALALAALLALTGPASQEEADDPHVAALRGVLATLIAITDSEQQNQTVLLVRV